MLTYDTIQVRSNCCLIYKQPAVMYSRVKKSILTQNFKGAKTYSGDISESAAKRIRKTVSVFVQRSPIQIVYNPIINKKVRFKLGFLTLTIPELTTDNQSYYYKNLLKPLLRYLKSRFGLNDYVWKAELQNRGSIHYHLTINTFIPYTYIRDKWNELLNKYGLMDSYKKEYGNTNPNSIDLHSVRDVSNIEAYLIKYISKKDKLSNKLKGKVWGCSESLQKATFFCEMVSFDVKDKIIELKEKGFIYLKYLEQCIILKYAKGANLSHISTTINDAYKNWCCGNEMLLPLVTQPAVGFAPRTPHR